MPRTDWPSYLDRFHRDRPGITEQLLNQAVHPGLGTAYDWMVAAAGSMPGAVIDLGCGSAPLHPLVTNASTYVGIDTSRSELAVAEDAGRGPVVEASVTALPFDDRCFDMAFSSMSIMLFQPLEIALAEVARVLRPGGRFVTIRPVTFPIRASDVRIGVSLARGLRGMPALPQRLSRSEFARAQRSVGLMPLEDEARRFGFSLYTSTDAELLVRSLYLPSVPTHRVDATVQRLTRRARSGREVPVSIRRTIAIKRA